MLAHRCAGKKTTVHKILGTMSAAAVALSLTVAAPAHAAPRIAGLDVLASPAQVTAAAPRDDFSMKQQWAREVTRYRDADSSPYNVDHVYELQYRLKWAGTFRKTPNGQFGKATRAAVKRFQKQEGMQRTGVAGHNTWAHLIHDTIQRRGVVPRICKKKGWHACYDRTAHQVTLWHNGEIRNSWLVRGGGYGIETRLGNTQVYYRDIDHVSAAFDSPMPYSQFFDGGQAYHGSGYMIDPFVGHSHGCINMYIEDARQLWRLTSDRKLFVSVYGAWD